MFWFYVWKPVLEIDEEEVYANIDWFWESLSWSTRDKFIACGINEKLVENWKNTIWNSPSSIFIRYTTIKDELEKIRYSNKIYWTDDLWIDRIIKQAIEKYWEEELFCMFS